jgi:hypothetical protein
VIRHPCLLATSEIDLFMFFVSILLTSMAPKPLDILKKGLSKFTNTIKARRDELNTRLARKETISSADEHWLDHQANTIDEQRILETLESASNYDRGFDRLDEKERAIVKTLREWAGDLVKATGKKRKRTAPFLE